MVNEVKRVVALPVVGYEGLYEVTSEGEVYSLNYNRTGKRVKMKAKVSHNGYQQIVIYKDNKAKMFYVHRLVAEAFIPNPDNKPHIDHINTIRTDNRAENIRWVTAKENHHNPFTESAQRLVTLKVRSKEVYCIELDKTFESAKEAARQLGLHRSSISECCKGKRQTTGGYHFRFA